MTWGFGNFTLRGGWATGAATRTARPSGHQICNGGDTGSQQYSLGASYNFSKRTLTYLYYTAQDNDDFGRYRMGTNTGPVTSNVPVGAKAQAFGLGIRHTF